MRAIQNNGQTLGTPITFGEQTAALVAEMCRRGRQSFAKHRNILLARTSLRSRIIAYTSLVRNSAETWPVNHRLLKAANSLQTQHMRGLLHRGLGRLASPIATLSQAPTPAGGVGTMVHLHPQSDLDTWRGGEKR